MAERLPTATQNALAASFAGLVDAGTGPGTVKVYTGAQPATANDAASGTLLATFTLNDPAFAVSGPVATLDVDPVVSTTGAATGTPGWFRLADSAGATVMDGAVGSGAELTLNTAQITATETVTVTSFTVTMPAE